MSAPDARVARRRGRAANLALLFLGLVSALVMSQAPAGAQEPVRSPTPIADVRADFDGDGVPDRLGDTVVVAGRATTGSTVLNRSQMRVFVQDATGGIMVFSFEPEKRVVAGDSVVTTGVVGHYNGLTQLRPLELNVVPAPPRTPLPVALPSDRDSLEAIEGRLVTARAVVKGTGGNEGGQYLLLGSEDAPEALFAVFVSTKHGASPSLGRFHVGDRLEVTGPLGQFDTRAPYDGFYQIYPRSGADIRATGLGRGVMVWLLWGGAGLLSLAAVTLLLARRESARQRRQLTESTRSERISRHQLSLLLQHVPIGLWTVDRDLRLTWMRGPAGLADQGGDMVGAPVADLLGDDEGPMLAYQRALAGGSEEFESKWGGRTWTVRLEPLVGDDGGVEGVVGAALDVTQFREVETSLEQHRTQFQVLFDEAPEAIVLVDEDDRVLQTNPEFERLFGYSAAESVGRSINDLIAQPGAEEEASVLTRRVAGGERLQVESVRRRKDGTPVDVSILATPVEFGGGRRVYGIYRDITQQKELETRLLRAQRLEAVGQLAGGVAHDFNNILTVILGQTSLVTEELGEQHPLHADVKAIDVAAQRAAVMTRQLLTFSRRDRIAACPLDLNEEIRKTHDFLVRLIEARVELRLSLEEGLPRVAADPGQIHQLLMNLVINARDAMTSGGAITIVTRTAPAAGRTGSATSEAGRRVVLEVQDEGIGMDDATRARIFEPFFTTKEPGRGTGLGLATVYGIVEQAGGHLEVDSAPGAGTRIRALFPFAGLPATEDHPDAAAASGGKAASDERRRILLVDDDKNVRGVTQRILTRAGYDVVSVDSGSAALEYCESVTVRPDLLLSDVVMPGLSGYELADAVGRLYPEIEVIMMTGYDQGLAEGGQGALEVIRKPFDPAALVGRIRERLSSAPV